MPEKHSNPTIADGGSVQRFSGGSQCLLYSTAIGMLAYEERDTLLLEMGYASYQEYLRSNRWNRIRKRVLSANDNQCVLCGKPANTVHHTDYSKATLQGECIDGLVALCDICHNLAEFTAAGTKRTLDEANNTLGFFQSTCRAPVEPAPNITYPSTLGHISFDHILEIFGPDFASELVRIRSLLEDKGLRHSFDRWVQDCVVANTPRYKPHRQRTRTSKTIRGFKRHTIRERIQDGLRETPILPSNPRRNDS